MNELDVIANVLDGAEHAETMIDHLLHGNECSVEDVLNMYLALKARLEVCCMDDDMTLILGHYQHLGNIVVKVNSDCNSELKVVHNDALLKLIQDAAYQVMTVPVYDNEETLNKMYPVPKPRLSRCNMLCKKHVDQSIAYVCKQDDELLCDKCLGAHLLFNNKFCSKVTHEYNTQFRRIHSLAFGQVMWIVSSVFPSLC